MKRGSPENRIDINQVNNPQEVVDTGKRDFLGNAARVVGAGVTIAALTQARRAYAAVETAINFRDRRIRADQPKSQSLAASSPSLDTQVTTQGIPQGQPVTVQETPTPDATVAAA